MQGHYFCHILHATEGTAGINTIPAAAPGHRERWNKADLGGGKGGRERDEVRQEPRWSRHGWEPRPGCLCRRRRPARQAANGAPTSGTRPASAPGPARPADRRAHRHTSTHRHTQTHTDTQTDAHKTHAQSLTWCPPRRRGRSCGWRAAPGRDWRSRTAGQKEAVARSGTGRQRSPFPRPAASHSTLPITPARSDPTETSPISPRNKGPGPGFPLPKWI